MPLTDRDRALLNFEAQWPGHVGAKEEAVRSAFGISPARYYQLLGRLVDAPEALAYDPMLIHRLRRLRDGRERVREAHTARSRRSAG